MVSCKFEDFIVAAKDGGYNFLQAFYDLGIEGKKLVVKAMEQQRLITYTPCEACPACAQNKPMDCREVYRSQRTLYRLGSAMLQHSTPQEKFEIPCKGIRTLSTAAKIEDGKDFVSRVKLLIDLSWKHKDGIPVEMICEIFRITEDDIRAYPEDPTY